MDNNKGAEPIKFIHITNDVNLPEVMAGLEMLTVNPNLSSTSNKRVLRKRLPKKVSNEILNRRCSLKPKKRKSSDTTSEEDIKEYYLDKSSKQSSHNLETIFEEKEGTNENVNFMSVRKFKRMIQFKKEPTDTKLKKRRAKIKKIFGSKGNYRNRRATMETLVNKLNGIRSDPSESAKPELK